MALQIIDHRNLCPNLASFQLESAARLSSRFWFDSDVEHLSQVYYCQAHTLLVVAISTCND